MPYHPGTCNISPIKAHFGLVSNGGNEKVTMKFFLNGKAPAYPLAISNYLLKPYFLFGKSFNDNNIRAPRYSCDLTLTAT